MPEPEPDDATRLDEFVQQQVEDAVRRRRAQERAEAVLRAETLASDLDRDRVSEVLNEAFAHGRRPPTSTPTAPRAPSWPAPTVTSSTS
jgi:hypothetical protein